MKNKTFNKFLKKPIDRNKTWSEIIKYHFVVSPHGNGLDCHRTWETLMLGSIPIVKTSSIDYLFKDLPVLILKEWSDINEELLENTIQEFSKKKFNMEKLTLNYWKIIYVKKIYIKFSLCIFDILSTYMIEISWINN